MNDADSRLSGGELGRWLVLASIILLGIVLFFIYAPRTQPVVLPPEVEVVP